MTNPRRDLARATYQADRAIDQMSRDLMQRIGLAIRKHDGPVTPEMRQAVLRDVDTALDEWYPKKRGAPSKLQALIESHARQAALLPVRDAVAVMRRHVPEELRRRMGDESGE